MSNGHLSEIAELKPCSRPRVFDEYEVDPKQNEGAKYQFHDVKRRKTDRKQMHGGDCECCKGVSGSQLPVGVDIAHLSSTTRRSVHYLGITKDRCGRITHRAKRRRMVTLCKSTKTRCPDIAKLCVKL